MKLLPHDTLCRLLAPFETEPTAPQLDQMSAYLELLLRWNAKINLTAIRTAEECVKRHFGESFYLGRFVVLSGRNLDIGSGAGFPALALKILWPGLESTLLEPVAKKRAFLKEVLRICRMSRVEVRPERLSDYISRPDAMVFDSVTSRAVGGLEKLLPQAVRCVKPVGMLCFWTTADPAALGNVAGIEWRQIIAVPGSEHRKILIGSPSRHETEGDSLGKTR
jgi:16S rRNA (guanine527-N7)-methyltransferase